jgi:hypothetical protein
MPMSVSRTGTKPAVAALACILLLAVSAVLVACDSSSPSSPNGPDNPPDVTPISEAVLLEHLNFFAADSLFGRRAGSQYERKAAQYISDRFSELGLEAGSPGYYQAFIIPVAVDGRTGLSSRNVLAVLPGTGNLASEWVVVGAHYDHLGFTQVTADSVEVFNGADDNASGTSLLLEVARYLSDYVEKVATGGAGRRSIIFEAYGAEEVGLVGSIHFCDNPTVPMDSIVAMVNLDMVGRLSSNTLGLIGYSSSSDWPAVLGRVNWQDLELASVGGLLNRSDQYCFYQKRKPVLFLHTGLHAQYHTPSDDVQLIDEAGMVRIGHFAASVILDLAFQPEAPQFSGGALLSSPAPGAVDLAETRR